MDRIVIKPKTGHPAYTPLPSGGRGEDGSAAIATDFSELRLRADVVSALEGIGITRPTLIQVCCKNELLLPSQLWESNFYRLVVAVFCSAFILDVGYFKDTPREECALCC